MGVFRDFFELYLPPHAALTPVPDDWPPDGSLHFIKCTAEAQTLIPKPYVMYEFGANIGEDDRRLLALSMELIQRLGGSRQVLTRIHSSAEWPKQQRHPPERFTVRYGRFLKHIGSSVSSHAPDEKTLLLLTKGFNAAAFWAGQDIDTSDGCFYDFYLLPQKLPVSDAKGAAQVVAAEQYDVWFNLSEYGPCALYMTLNPKTVDVGGLQGLIAAICAENGILFQNPPARWIDGSGNV